MDAQLPQIKELETITMRKYDWQLTAMVAENFITKDWLVITIKDTK